MIKFVMMVLLLSGSVSSLAFGATNPCKNYAKNAAIRAYKSETGTIQGSDGIKYVATQVKNSGQFFEFQVTISDNNEDGETWNVDYLVQLQRNATCKVVKVQKLKSKNSPHSQGEARKLPWQQPSYNGSSDHSCSISGCDYDPYSCSISCNQNETAVCRCVGRSGGFDEPACYCE